MTEQIHPAVAYLRAAHQRAEETARAATSGPWKARHWPDRRHTVIGGSHPLPGAETDNRVVHRDGGYEADWPRNVVNAEADADHIALHDPRAVLRRVAAERKTLAECANMRYTAADLEMWVLNDYADTIERQLAEGWGWEAGR